jgi:hypothetical protein
VTSGLLRMLDPDERAAVLAHERAHLRLRHHRLIAIAELAAAVHPLLSPVADGVGLLVERASDEDAAATVGDRRLVARTVAKVALAAQSAGDGGLARGAGAMGIGGSDLLCRIDALTRPPVSVSRVWSALAGAVVLAAFAAAGGAAADFIGLIRAWWPSA